MKKRPTAAAAGLASAASRAGLPQALAQAIDHLRHERLDEAEPALLDILERWPEQPDAQHFLGVLRHTQGQADEAVALIRRALAQIPDLPSAWNNLGNVLQLAGRINEAAQAYAQAVAHAANALDRAMAHNNVGQLHRRLMQLDLSEQAFRRALEQQPDYADSWYNLSETLIQQGRIAEGIQAHSRARVLWPRHLQRRSDVIRSLMLLGELAQAAELLREWLAESPQNPVAEHMLAACQSVAAPARASDSYVEEVFDQFAASFDSKLEALGYRAPELVVQALAAAIGPAAGRLDIADAGCGTGLCGPGLRPWARQLAGCDLSAGMLRQARSRKAYDALHKAELTYYLDTQPGAFDAVVSADTLCYFGSLEAVSAAAHRSLRPGGWLVYTVEALPDGTEPGHRLQANGRYAHERGYIEHTLEAAGFGQVSLQHDRLRLEGGLPVMGWVVSARRLTPPEGKP